MRIEIYFKGHLIEKLPKLYYVNIIYVSLLKLPNIVAMIIKCFTVT